MSQLPGMDRWILAAALAATLTPAAATEPPPATPVAADALADPALRGRTAAALGDAASHLVFVPLPPCRIIDTRLQGTATGPLVAGQARAFLVAGVDGFLTQGGKGGGCGVPRGDLTTVATAVAINFVAVGPAGPGHLQAWEFGQPMPAASILNYANLAGLNIANGVVVPIAGDGARAFDLWVRAAASSTHLVADVTGYFTRFPSEQIAAGERSIVVTSDGGAVDFATSGRDTGGGCPPGKTCCFAVNSCTLTSTSPGKAVIRSWAQVAVSIAPGDGGAAGQGNRLLIGTVATEVDPLRNCPNSDQSVNASDFEVPHTHGPDDAVQWVLTHKRVFDHVAGTRTYWMNGLSVTGIGPGDGVVHSRMICTFIPD